MKSEFILVNECIIICTERVRVRATEREQSNVLSSRSCCWRRSDSGMAHTKLLINKLEAFGLHLNQHL